MYMGYGVGMGGFGWLFMIVFWGLVIFGIVYLIKAATAGTKGETRTETALDVLKKRYAAGEISKEEFKERKAEIT